MSASNFFWWCVAVGIGGAFVIGCIGMAIAFAIHVLLAAGWRRR